MAEGMREMKGAQATESGKGGEGTQEIWGGNIRNGKFSMKI